MRLLTFLRMLMVVAATQLDRTIWPRVIWQDSLATLFSTPASMPTVGFGRVGLQTLSQRRGLIGFARSRSERCRRIFG